MVEVVYLAARRSRVAPEIEVGDPAAVARCKLAQAAEIQCLADAIMEQEARFAGLVAGKLRDGDTLAAEHYEVLRADAERMFLAMDEEAFRLRLEACELEARAARFSALVGVTSFPTGGLL